MKDMEHKKVKRITYPEGSNNGFYSTVSNEGYGTQKGKKNNIP